MKALEPNQHDAVSGGIAPLFLRIPSGYRLPVEPPMSTAPLSDTPVES